MKLIVDRRKVAAGIAGLITMPAIVKAASLDRVPLELRGGDFFRQGGNGLLKPDWTRPMVRIVFDDGTTTEWHRYSCMTRFPVGGPQQKKTVKAIAIESVAPDGHGMPRFAQVPIG